MLLSDVEGMVKQDLFDPGAARWQTSDIDRAIDKAVVQYSWYGPNVVYVDMQCEAYQRTYPYPTPWNASYPVYWIDKILYPLQVYGTYFASPLTAPGAAAAAGAGMSIGVYQYLVTYLSQGGETTAGPVVSVTTSGGNQQVALSNIPICNNQPVNPGVATNNCIGRNIYRTLVGGTVFHLVTTVQDNTTTTYTDVASDATITPWPAPPTVNSSGVMVWPSYDRNFSEYSNLYDSNTALARGGNQGVMGVPGDAIGPTGTQQGSFTLNLSPAELPKDNTLVMRLFYATKHQLDANGSTIPEIHRDVIVLGAVAYCLEAYQIPTNDNFDFQDGGLRDRLDDTAIPKAWLAAAANKMKQFQAKLVEIKQQRDFAASSRAHWGDTPVRWTRL